MGMVILCFVAGCFLLRHPTVLLPYDEFNAKGSGWRAIYDSRGDCRKAADEIEMYFRFHPGLAAGDRTILHFHAAQMFAGAGMNARAMPHLDQATNSFMSSDWNDMVAATRAFLMRDRVQLDAARERLITAHASDDSIQEADMLVAHFGESYADMRWWALIGTTVAISTDASPPHRAAAEKLAKAFGLSLTTATTKPDHCLWLELHSWDASTDHWKGYNYWDGYIILHYDSGTVISASNLRWLDAGVERFIKSCRKRGDKWEAPTGMTTSFSLSR
jgi:hypothetical protein